MSFFVRTRTSPSPVPIVSLVEGRRSYLSPVPGVGAVQRIDIEPGETGEIIRLDHHITLHREGVTDLWSRHDGEEATQTCLHPGLLHIRPAQASHASAWTSPASITIFSIEPRFLREQAADLFHRDLASVSLRPMIGVKDDFLWQLGMRADAVASMGDPPRAFIETLLSTMAMHLILSANAKPLPVTARALSQAALRRTREHIEANLSSDISLATLAALSGLSTYHFSRQFMRETGIGVARFIQTCRMARASELLGDRSKTIAEIGEAVGYSDASAFSRAFRSVHGFSPQAFRRQSL